MKWLRAGMALTDLMAGRIIRDRMSPSSGRAVRPGSAERRRGAGGGRARRVPGPGPASGRTAGLRCGRRIAFLLVFVFLVFMLAGEPASGTAAGAVLHAFWATWLLHRAFGLLGLAASACSSLCAGDAGGSSATAGRATRGGYGGGPIIFRAGRRFRRRGEGFPAGAAVRRRRSLGAGDDDEDRSRLFEGSRAAGNRCLCGLGGSGADRELRGAAERATGARSWSWWLPPAITTGGNVLGGARARFRWRSCSPG